MITINEAVEKFNKLPVEIAMTVDSDEVSKVMLGLNQKYGIDISALIIFVIIGELELEKIDTYLIREFELDGQKASSAKKEITDLIFNPVIKRINFLSANLNKNISLREEEQIIKNILTSNVLKEMSGDPVIVYSINARIFYALSHDLNIKSEFEKAFLSNQEIVARITVSDWLKDFISQKGSGLFDDLVLTDFVLHSPNCQKLKDEDRRLVQKLLLLYRNLKFFPDSMPNDTGEGWEIIPIDDAVADIDRPALKAPKSEEEKRIEALKAEKESFKPDSLEGKMIEEEINNEKKIEGLKLMAKRYLEGSLEWKAIMDEVRKLQN